MRDADACPLCDDPDTSKPRMKIQLPDGARLVHITCVQTAVAVVMATTRRVSAARVPVPARYQSTLSEAAQLLRLRQVFRAGNLSAKLCRPGEELPPTGLLPQIWAGPLRDTQHRRAEAVAASQRPDAPVYLVYSGETLIAWATLAGMVAIPDLGWAAGYRDTIERHQAIVREAFGLSQSPRTG